MSTSANVDPHHGRGTRRVRTPIVDQHATWIALNPIQGCPKSCEYCFLQERGQTSVRPEELASPARTVDLLTASPWYAPDRPVALYTWTDVMALPASRAHLTALLGELAQRCLPNPFVVITKCAIPDETVEAIAAARQAGVRLIVYLSYSGLSPAVEKGIRHEQLRANFPRLTGAGVPVVHYWRPAYPESATTATMEAVVDWASTYARCTVAAGLKVEPAALPRLARRWPELATTPGVTTAEGVYPRAFWDFLHATATHRPDYPLFHTNSCALTYTLGESDRFGIFGSPVCTSRNRCPDSQRLHCAAAFAQRPVVTDTAVRAALAQRGHPDLPFTLALGEREVRIEGVLPTNVVAALTQDLGLRVSVTRQAGDRYWSSGTAGARPLVLGDAP